MKSLLLLPTLFCLLPQNSQQTPQAPTRAPELPGPIDTPQGQIGPLGITYPDELPIVSSWFDLKGTHENSLKNSLLSLGWDLSFMEAERRWISGEGTNELSIQGVHRDALVSVAGRLLLRGPEAQVAALRGAIEALAPQFSKPAVSDWDYRTYRPAYISPRGVQEVANVLSQGGLSFAPAQDGAVLVQGATSELDKLSQWLAEHDQPPPSGRLALEAFVRQEGDQIVAGTANELPADLAASLAELFPGQRFVRAEGAMAAFSATGDAPLSLTTFLFGLGPADLPPARLRLNAKVGAFDPQRGSLSLRDLMLNLELPTLDGYVDNSLATEIMLEPGVPTLLGSLNGNRVLFVLRLMAGPG
jgi:hypothetical protein